MRRSNLDPIEAPKLGSHQPKPGIMAEDDAQRSNACSILSALRYSSPRLTP